MGKYQITNKCSLKAHCIAYNHLPVCEAVFLPLGFTPKSRETANFSIWNAAAGPLHHCYCVFIKTPCDPEAKESLHVTQLPGLWTDPPSSTWTLILFKVEEVLQVALEKKMRV